MDEPKKGQDTSERDSSDQAKGTSEKTPETLAKEQEKATRKAVSDALSSAGRTATALEKRAEDVKSGEERLREARKAKDDAELATAEGDMSETARIKTKQAYRDTLAENATLKQQLEAEKRRGTERDKETAETTREVTVFEIATKHTVDAARLKELSKLTDGSNEAIEAIAQSMTKNKESVVKEPLVKVSTETIGGGKTDEQRLKERYPTM